MTTTCDGCGRDVTIVDLHLTHTDDGTPACTHNGVAYSTSTPGDTVRCDFCSTPTTNPHRYIRVPVIVAADISLNETLENVMSEDWEICPACADDAAARLYDNIIGRSLNRYLDQHPDHAPHRATLHSRVLELHSTVWESWDGTIHTGGPQR